MVFKRKRKSQEQSQEPQKERQKEGPQHSNAQQQSAKDGNTQKEIAVWCEHEPKDLYSQKRVTLGFMWMLCVTFLTGAFLNQRLD
jgi:hypothetical protein